MAKSAVQTVFQAADADRNSMLSMDEYDKALAEPAHAVFRVLDANGDNQLTLAELQRAEQIIADQIQRLRVPEPANSVSNQSVGGEIETSETNHFKRPRVRRRPVRLLPRADRFFKKEIPDWWPGISCKIADKSSCQSRVLPRRGHI